MAKKTTLFKYILTAAKDAKDRLVAGLKEARAMNRLDDYVRDYDKAILDTEIKLFDLRQKFAEADSDTAARAAFQEIVEAQILLEESKRVAKVAGEERVAFLAPVDIPEDAE